MGEFPNKSTQFTKDKQPDGRGRPRKFVCELKDQGYKQSEINDTILAMLAMDIEELKDVWQNPKATILEKTIAAAMRKSIERGSLYSIETLITRAYGKPKETVEQTIHTETDMSKLSIETILAIKKDLGEV